MSTAVKPRALAAQETAGRLVALARERFAEDGFAGVSLDALAAGAGLTRGALHHHFGNKTGLFEAVLRKVDEEIEAAVDHAWSAEPDPWRQFCVCFSTYLVEAMHPSRRRILFQDAPAVLGPRAYDILLEGGFHYVCEDLRGLAAQGLIAPVDPEAAAHFLNGACLNLAFWVAEGPPGEDRLARALATQQAILDGLARRTPG